MPNCQSLVRADFQVQVAAPESDGLAPAEACEGEHEDQGAVPGRPWRRAGTPGGWLALAARPGCRQQRRTDLAHNLRARHVAWPDIQSVSVGLNNSWACLQIAIDGKPGLIKSVIGFSRWVQSIAADVQAAREKLTARHPAAPKPARHKPTDLDRPGRGRRPTSRYPGSTSSRLSSALPNSAFPMIKRGCAPPRRRFPRRALAGGSARAGAPRMRGTA